jgi:alkylation response protein AidB-like acyl-CoA dehydrogenase
VGPLEKKIEALVGWAREALRDAKAVKDDPVVRSRIARAVTELEVARMLQRRVISAALRDRVPTIEASEYKLYMNECGKRVANTALDLMGPEGALRGGRFERSYRYTVVDTIGGGTSEIQKNIIASRGLALPRSF